MKLEQAARQAFETWWEREGQEFLYALNTTTDDDIKLVAEVAWKNGAYCAEQAEQEPVVKIHKYNEFQTLSSLNLPIGTKLYAAPVRTKDLTDDEIFNLNECESSADIAFARAVIAAYKEKNK